jgi:hypothetical protein
MRCFLTRNDGVVVLMIKTISNKKKKRIQFKIIITNSYNITSYIKSNFTNWSMYLGYYLKNLILRKASQTPSPPMTRYTCNNDSDNKNIEYSEVRCKYTNTIQ